MFLQIINIQDIIRSKSIDEMKDVYVHFTSIRVNFFEKPTNGWFTVHMCSLE